MIVLLVLCEILSCASLTVPASYTRESVLHSTQYDLPVRAVHPSLNIVTGREFIASVDSDGEITKRRDIPVDSGNKAACLIKYSEATCSSYATSVIQLSNNTLYYCYSNSRSPLAKSSSNDLLTNNDNTLQKSCLVDPEREAHSLQYGADTLYLVSDSAQENTGNFYSLNVTTSKSITSKPGYLSSIQSFKVMFARQNFVYSIYTTTSASSSITRTCLADQGHGTSYFSTFTKAALQCKSGTTVFTKVIRAEYDSEQDLLFVLFSRDPRELSADILCAFNFTFVDNVFDTGTYSYYDRNGQLKNKTGSPIDCSQARTTDPERNMIECVNVISTSTILYNNLVNYNLMTLYRVKQRLLFYLITGEELHVLRYNGKTADLILTVQLWASASDFKITSSSYISSSSSTNYMLASGTKSYVGYPFWCSYYKQDPVNCLAVQHPDCSYSTVKHECIATYQCGTTDCHQSLDNGSFSAAFPQGHIFTIRGALCDNGTYHDTQYSYTSQGVLTTLNSTRKCGDDKTPVTPSPVTKPGSWSTRETWLLIALIVVLVGFVLIGLKLLKDNGTFRRRSMSAVSPNLSKLDDIEESNDVPCSLVAYNIVLRQDPLSPTPIYKEDTIKRIRTVIMPHVGEPASVKEINGGQSIKSKVVSFVKGQEHGDTAVVIGNKNSVSEEVP